MTRSGPSSIDPAWVVDLSANLHPAGPDPEVLQAARSARLDRYPPPDAAPLRLAIAAACGLDPSMVLVTPGGTAGLHLVARAVLRPGDRALAFPPTFGEYRAATEANGAEFVEARSSAPSFRPALEETARLRPSLTLLCQPNNPTGVYLDRAEVEQAAARTGLLVVDAAYNDFVEGAWDPDDLVRSGLPVLVVHSMTKLHAIPGLRLGYVVGAPDLVARLEALQPSWSIDAASMAAGVVAIGQRGARIALLEETHRVRERLREALHELGYETAPGRANFLLVHTGAAGAVRHVLLREGFLVRDCTSFGLPVWIRVAVSPSTHLDALIRAFGVLNAAGEG